MLLLVITLVCFDVHLHLFFFGGGRVHTGSPRTALSGLTMALRPGTQLEGIRSPELCGPSKPHSGWGRGGLRGRDKVSISECQHREAFRLSDPRHYLLQMGKPVAQKQEEICPRQSLWDADSPVGLEH